MDRFQPGDLVRYQEPTPEAPWFEAQLVERQGLRRVDERGAEPANGGWSAVVTDTGTYFGVEEAAQVLGQTVRLAGHNLALVQRGRRWRGRLVGGGVALVAYVLLRSIGAFEGGQTSWMLAIAVFGVVGLVFVLRRRR